MLSDGLVKRCHALSCIFREEWLDMTIYWQDIQWIGWVSKGSEGLFLLGMK